MLTIEMANRNALIFVALLLPYFCNIDAFPFVEGIGRFRASIVMALSHLMFWRSELSGVPIDWAFTVTGVTLDVDRGRSQFWTGAAKPRLSSSWEVIGNALN